MNPSLLPSHIDTSDIEMLDSSSLSTPTQLEEGNKTKPKPVVTFPSLSSSSSSGSGGILHESEDEYIRRHLNIFSQFKDPSIRQEYITFAGFRKSVTLLFFVNIFFTAVFLHAGSSQIKYNQSDQDYAKLTILSYLALLCTFLTAVSGWMLLYFQVFQQPAVNCVHRILQCGRTYRHYFQCIFYVCAVSSYSFRIVQRTYTGQCPENLPQTMLYTWNCNPYGDDNGFPTESIVILMLIPLTFTTIMRETRLDVLLGSWLISSTALIVCAFKLGAPTGLPVVIPYVFYCLFIILDISSQNLHMFFLNRRLRETMEENERMAEQVKQNELRSMIANVAHDLKTPLSSFMTGIDIITHVVKEYEQKSIPGLNAAQRQGLLEETFSSIKTCLTDIKNTNSFMLMTINRCIDYTKASKGFKLVPKYETVDLLDTLSLPLICMKNIQNKISIQLAELPAGLCSHIITDKQWLQENVLCLLSNAVKYSSSGEVIIALSLHLTSDNASLTREKTAENSFYLAASSRSDVDVDINTIGNDSGTTIPPSRSYSSAESTPRRATPAGYLLIEIQDCGIGVPSELKSSLFNPFKQTQRLAGGTGLGLYSLAKRVEALSGECGVKERSDGKQGSIFWFTIPYRPDRSVASLQKASVSSIDLNIHRSVQILEDFKASHEVVLEEHAALMIELPTESKRFNILIVEDSPTIARMTSMMLRRHGHEVSVAENGEIALNMIIDRWKSFPEGGASSKDAAFDAVLMDLQMPVMDGLEATRRLRLYESGKHRSSSFDEVELLSIKRNTQAVIGVSANSDEETSCAAIAAGIDAFIAKPFNVETFYEVLNSVKEQHSTTTSFKSMK